MEQNEQKETMTVMLFLEDRNGRLIRVCVPSDEIPVLTTESRKPTSIQAPRAYAASY